MSIAMVTFVVILAAGVVSSVSFSAVELPAATEMPLAVLIESLFAAQWLRTAVSVALIMLNAILLTRLGIRYGTKGVRTYIPMNIYVVAACGIVFPSVSVCGLLAGLLLIVSSAQMISAFKRQYRFEQVFKSAICMGILPLLHAPSICLLVVLVLLLSLYQRTAREAIVALAGYFLPFILCSAGWWFAGAEWSYVGEAFVGSLTAWRFIDPKAWLVPEMIPAGITVLICLSTSVVSIVALLLNKKHYPARMRKVYIHFMILLLFCACMVVAPSGNLAVSLSLVAVPITAMGTFFFTNFRGRISVAVYVLLILSYLISAVQPFFL